MVNALHEKYQETPDENLFAELPFDIQELLLESRVQAREGKTRTH